MITTLKQTETITCECGNTFRWNPNFSSIKPKRCAVCENKLKLEKQRQYANKYRQNKLDSLEQQRKNDIGTGGRGAETIHNSFPKIHQPKKQMRVKFTRLYSKQNNQPRVKKGRTKWFDLPTNDLIQHVQQKIVNPYIRKRDKVCFHNHCISCAEGKVEEAGHFFSVGSTPEMRLMVCDIHGQCHDCNSTKGGFGNPDYENGLIARHGQKYLFELHKVHADCQNSNTKLLRSDILEIARTYKHLSKNNIWVFTQEEFEEVKEKLQPVSQIRKVS